MIKANELEFRFFDTTEIKLEDHDKPQVESDESDDLDIAPTVMVLTTRERFDVVPAVFELRKFLDKLAEINSPSYVKPNDRHFGFDQSFDQSEE